MRDDQLMDVTRGTDDALAPGQERLALPAEPAAVAALRNEARDFALAHGADELVAGDVALAISEAATNAVLHAFLDREPGTLTLVCDAGRDRLRFRVVDDGRGMQPRPDSPGMGIGLSTIAMVASGMDVRPGEGGLGTEVAMTFDAPGVQGPFAAPADPAEAELLDAASRLAQSAAWPEEGVERLAELLVGELADAVTVDLVDDGVLRRISARVADDDVLSAWLAASLPPMKPGTATWKALHGDSPALVVHDPSQPRASHGPGERLGLAWWLSCPLPDRAGRPAAILGLGGREHRPAPGPRAVALAAEIAERAAGGLAQARVVDDLRRTRRRLEGILGALTEAVTVSNAEGRIVWANDAAARMLDAPSAEALVEAGPGMVAADFVMTGEDGAPLSVDELPSRRLLAGRDAPPLVTRSVNRRTGRATWMRTTARLLDEGTGQPLAVNIIEDITEARRATLRRQALDRAGRLLDVPDPADPAVLQAVCEAIAPVKADWCAIDVLADGRLERVALMHADPELLELGRTMSRRWPARPESFESVLAGEPQLVADVPDELLASAAQDAEHAELLRRIALRSALRVPLRGGGAVHGVLTLAHAESGRRFGEEDVVFAADLGRRIGLAIAYARVAAASRTP